jgi:hypothetical protein
MTIGGIGLVMSTGGVAFFVLGIPPLAAGIAILRGIPLARPADFMLALASASTLGLLASTPFRGLTPPVGSPPPDVDLASTVLAVLFLLVAVMLVIAKPTSRA